MTAPRGVSTVSPTIATARILADSISEAGYRLTTVEVTFARSALAEVNTHRAFCLAGDAVLEFDLPAGRPGGRRTHTMRLDDFVDKWQGGARRVGANPKVTLDLSWIEPDTWYPAQALADRLSYSKSAIHLACRNLDLKAQRGADGRSWEVLGQSFIEWRESRPAHTRFLMRDRLARMQIRQLDEVSGRVVTSSVVDCCVSGRKEVFEVSAGGFAVAGSADHLVLTGDGWTRIGDLLPGTSQIVVRQFGKQPDDRLDPIRLKKLEGVWRNKYQNEKRATLLAVHGGCQECGSAEDLHVHHTVPVHERPDLVFVDSNLELLCASHHRQRHNVQGWQGGTYLYGREVVVDSVVSRGVETTYDLSIAGDHPNFLANGVVVHNSRNSASSRAVPVAKMLAQASEHPFIPRRFSIAQRGMSASRFVEPGDDRWEECLEWWLDSRDYAVEQAERGLALGLHKQDVNRLLEPFLMHTAIISATEWDNFFHLRLAIDDLGNPLAYPPIYDLAVAIQQALRDSKPESIWSSWHWHLPLASGEDADLSQDARIKLSVARCARVSYLTHDGRRDPQADIDLYERLKHDLHLSPFEHAAHPLNEGSANFRGWRQARWYVEHGDSTL